MAVNHPTLPRIIPISVLGADKAKALERDKERDDERSRKRQAPKGRRVDPAALTEVQTLLGNASRQADLLIEHLHKIQDRFGHLSAAHLAALAQERSAFRC